MNPTSSTATFGVAKMSAKVAVPEDLADVVKSADEIPSVDDSVSEDVVQLTGNSLGYKHGHFYKFYGASEGWIDIGECSSEVESQGFGSFECETITSGTRITFKWADPVGTDRNPWIRSSIVEKSIDSTTVIGEKIIVSSTIRDEHSDSGYDYISMLSQSDVASKLFLLRCYFNDGSFCEYNLENRS